MHQCGRDKPDVRDVRQMPSWLQSEAVTKDGPKSFWMAKTAHGHCLEMSPEQTVLDVKPFAWPFQLMSLISYYFGHPAQLASCGCRKLLAASYDAQLWPAHHT